MSSTAGQTGLDSRPAGRLVVDRWINTYVVPAGAGRASLSAIEDLPRRVDRAVAEELASSCSAWLDAALDLASPAVWRIRELDLNLIVDAVAPQAHAVAQQWAEHIVLRIAQVIDRNAQGMDSDDVLSFENWGTYLGQFVLDLACGRAWQQWYYEEFFSLNALSMSKAITAALTRDPGNGAQALVYLAAANRLEEVLAVLTHHDAVTLHRECFGADKAVPSSRELSQWCGRILDLSRQSPRRLANSAHSDAHDALRWLAMLAVRFSGALQDPAARAAVSGLIELRRVLAALRSPIAADRLVRNLVERNAGVGETLQAALSLGANSPEQAVLFLAQIGMGDSDWAMQAAAELLRDQLPAQAAHAGESMLTAIGGVFLLGRALLELNLHEVTAAAAGSRASASERASLLRYLVLAKCVNSSRNPAAFSDPALRIFSGCESAVSYGYSAAEETFAPEDLHCAARILAHNLAASTGSRARCLLAELIPLSRQGDEALILRDVERDVYLFACPWPSALGERDQALTGALDLVRKITGEGSPIVSQGEPDVLPLLLVGESLGACLAPGQLRDKIHSLLVLTQKEPDEAIIEALLHAGCIDASTSPVKIAELLVPSTRELDAFSTSRIWPQLDVHLDLLCRLLARAVLRDFARSLKGFQANHPDYLQENFLEGVSTIRLESDRIEVELPRSPLALVLQLSGLSRQRYTVPWLPGREIWLTPSQA